MEKLYLTEKVLASIGRMLGGYGIKVVCDGSRPHVDLTTKTIHLPHLPPTMLEDTYALLHAFIDHECGHVVGESDDRVADEIKAKHGQVGFDCLNALEDVRIERVMAKKWAGCGVNLNRGRQVMRNMHDQRTKVPEPMGTIVAAQEIAFGETCCPRAIEPEAWQKALGIKALLDTVADAASTRAIVPAVEALIALLPKEDGKGGGGGGDGPPSPNNPSTEGQGEGEGQGQGEGEGKGKGKGGTKANDKGKGEGEGQADGNGGEGEGQGGDGQGEREGKGGDGESEGESKQPGQTGDGGAGSGGNGAGGFDGRPPIERTANEFVGKGNMAEVLSEHLRYNPEVTEEARKGRSMNVPIPPGPWPSDLKTVLSAGAQQRLAQVLMVKDEGGWLRPLSSGSVDVNRLAGLAAGTTCQVMRRRFTTMTSRVATSVLVDGSGSMQKTKARCARDAAVALGVAVERGGGACRIGVFIDGYPTTTVRIFKPWNLPVRACGPALGRMLIAQGGTPLGPAMMEAIDDLLARPEKRKVLLVLTDGMSDNQDLCKRVAEGGYLLGVEMVCVGIRGDHGQSWAKHHVSVDAIAELGKSAMNQLCNILTKGAR